MSTYYKHTRTEKAEVPYSFRCEHCSKDSGSMWAAVVGEAATNSSFRNLNDEQETKLRESAHKSLVIRMKELHKDVTEKNIFPTAFSDTCPHCHQPQSWAVSGLKNKMFENPIVALCVGGIFALIAVIGHYFSDEEYMTLSLAAGIFALGAAVAAVLLIWNVVKLEMKKKKTSSGAQKNLPVIDWEAVRGLLDEPSK